MFQPPKTAEGGRGNEKREEHVNNTERRVSKGATAFEQGKGGGTGGEGGAGGESEPPTHRETLIASKRFADFDRQQTKIFIDREENNAERNNGKRLFVKDFE